MSYHNGETWREFTEIRDKCLELEQENAALKERNHLLCSAMATQLMKYEARWEKLKEFIDDKGLDLYDKRDIQARIEELEDD